MKVKGVNLGNWLVLEKWMSPSLFDGTTAEDEYYLPTQLSKEVYEAKIKIHRSEYITERDFTRIKSMGMDAVRIPVPYFIFGDREPFLVPYLFASLSRTVSSNSTSSGSCDHLQTPLIPPLSNPFWLSGAVCKSIKI